MASYSQLPISDEMAIKKNKRYNLSLPEQLYEELGREANERGVTIVELLRSFIKLGLLIMKMEKKDDVSLIIREGDVEREIILLFP
jgi:hypothetical protein